MATSNTQTNFQAQPGQGWLMFNKRPSENIALWTGTLMLEDGVQAQLNAQAITDGKKSRYEVTVKQIGEPGKPWPVLSEFVIKPFGDKFSQEIKIPGIGVAKIWKQTTSTQRSAIRFQILNAKRPSEAVM